MQARMLVHTPYCEIQPILMTSTLTGVHKMRQSDENILNVLEGILSETLSYNTLACFAQNNSLDHRQVQTT